MSAKVAIKFNGNSSNLRSDIKRNKRELRGFGRTVKRVSARGGVALAGITRKIGSLPALAGGVAVFAAMKGVISYESRLARLGIQAGMTKDEITQLKKELHEIGYDTYQLPGSLLAGIEQIVEKTGNLKFARASLKDLGIVSSATNAGMAAIGATASDLQEKLDISPDQVLAVFDILNAQGKKGSFTLQNMAALFPRLLSAAASLGVSGVDGVRKFGAFLQLARRGTGSSEQAATAVERTFADIVAKSSMLENAGIKVFDPVRTKAEGRKVFNSFDLILKEIMVKTKGDITVLQKIFGEESIRAINPLIKTYQKFGDLRELDLFSKFGGDGKEILKDFKTWSEQTEAQLTRLQSKGTEFRNTNLAAPIQKMTDAMKVLNQHPELTNAGMWAGVGVGGLATGGAIYAGGKKFFAQNKEKAPAKTIPSSKKTSRWYRPSVSKNLDLSNTRPTRSIPTGKILKITKFGKIVGKKALKAIPFLGAAITIYEVGSLAKELFFDDEKKQSPKPIDAVARQVTEKVISRETINNSSVTAIPLLSNIKQTIEIAIDSTGQPRVTQTGPIKTTVSLNRGSFSPAH